MPKPRIGTVKRRRLVYNGEGIDQNYIQAHMWITLAVSKSDRVKYSSELDLAASSMTPEEIAMAQHLARRWKPKLSNQ